MTRINDFGFGAWAACCGPGFKGFGSAGRRRGRRRRRVFDKGDLKYMVLQLLEEEPMHGYEVMQRLEAESGGFYTASPGSVYPVLQMLQDQGYVSAEERDGKRVYSITAEGRSFLEENRDRVEDVADRVADFGDRFMGRDMRELTASFIRLAQAGYEGAMRAAGDAEAVSGLRDILDRAREEIEREWSPGAKRA